MARLEIEMLALALCLAVGSAAAEAPRVEDPHVVSLRRLAAQWEERQEAEERLRTEWLTLRAERVEGVARAREKQRLAREGRVRARDGGYKGVGRSEWIARDRAARAEIAEAERALEAFDETSRGEGIPPGWTRLPLPAAAESDP